MKHGYFLLAQKLQEAAAAMCHDDIQQRLRDSLNEMCRGTGNWCYLVAVFGDDQSGDVVYSYNSDLKKAPYTISGATAKIDTTTAVDVCPLTTYEVETAEVMEAGARNSKRDMGQIQSIHDAAGKLGATCKMAEAAKPKAAAVALVESGGCELLGAVTCTEAARTRYPVKLISPGTGSSAHYPAEVLERDGPKHFKAGTLMFWNHPTAQEAAARPEGDLNNLAAILTTDATYQHNGAKGPGLYAEAKVMADYAQLVEERAPHIGLSIRAGGSVSGKTVDGKPVLSSIDYAESVDYVTKAGRGGMALAEAARDAGILQETDEMDEAKARQLIQEAVAPYRARLIRSDAREQATSLLESVNLPAAAKQKIITQCLEGALPETADGNLDTAKFNETVVKESKAMGEFIASLLGSGQITGMGAASYFAPLTEADVQAREAAGIRLVKQTQDLTEKAESVFGDLMGNAEAAKAAAGRKVA